MEPKVVNLNPPVLGKLRHGLGHFLSSQGANLQLLRPVPGDGLVDVQQTAASHLLEHDAALDGHLGHLLGGRYHLQGREVQDYHTNVLHRLFSGILM